MAVKLNQRVEGMEEVIAPTDSRWREDIALFEEGDKEQAQKVRNDLEERQRRKRRPQPDRSYLDDGDWRPQFFKRLRHP